MLETFAIIDKVIGITVDEVHGFVYWGTRNGMVRRARLDGSDKMDVYNTGKRSRTSLTSFHDNVRLWYRSSVANSHHFILFTESGFPE